MSSTDFDKNASGSTNQIVSDHELLIQNNQFIRDDEEDMANIHKWEIRMARNFYDKLYRE